MWQLLLHRVHFHIEIFLTKFKAILRTKEFNRFEFGDKSWLFQKKKLFLQTQQTIVMGVPILRNDVIDLALHIQEKYIFFTWQLLPFFWHRQNCAPRCTLNQNNPKKGKGKNNYKEYLLLFELNINEFPVDCWQIQRTKTHEKKLTFEHRAFFLLLFNSIFLIACVRAHVFCGVY